MKKTKRVMTEKQKTTQEALQVTWLLKGKLKSAQIAYLKIGELLARVRDQQMWLTLHHESIEEYAEKKLQLGRASLYRYLQVYDWVKEAHPDWLLPKPQGVLPDFSDMAELSWIEKELERKDLSAKTRTALESLQTRGLEGKLTRRDVAPFRR